MTVLLSMRCFERGFAMLLLTGCLPAKSTEDLENRELDLTRALEQARRGPEKFRACDFGKVLASTTSGDKVSNSHSQRQDGLSRGSSGFSYHGRKVLRSSGVESGCASAFPKVLIC